MLHDCLEKYKIYHCIILPMKCFPFFIIINAKVCLLRLVIKIEVRGIVLEFSSVPEKKYNV